MPLHAHIHKYILSKHTYIYLDSELNSYYEHKLSRLCQIHGGGWGSVCLKRLEISSHIWICGTNLKRHSEVRSCLSEWLQLGHRHLKVFSQIAIMIAIFRLHLINLNCRRLFTTMNLLEQLLGIQMGDEAGGSQIRIFTFRFWLLNNMVKQSNPILIFCSR